MARMPPFPTLDDLSRESYKALKAMVLQLDPAGGDDDDAEQRVRVQLEKRFERDLSKAFDEQLTTLLPTGADDNAIRSAPTMVQATSEPVREVLRRHLAAGGSLGVNVALDTLETVGLAFDYTLANAQAAQWASRYSYDLIRGINTTTERAMQTAVNDWFNERTTLPDLVRELEPTFGRRRSKLIAQTETTRAAYEGNLAGYEESKVVDELDWVTVRDERVCPTCGPLDGKKAPLRGTFEGGFAPPAHPGCRCFCRPVVAGRKPKAPPAPPPPAPEPSKPLDYLGEAARQRAQLADRVKDVTYDTSEGAKVRQKLLKAQDKSDESVRAIWDKYHDDKRTARHARLDAQALYGADDPRVKKLEAAYQKIVEKEAKEVKRARDKVLETIEIRPQDRQTQSAGIQLEIDDKWIHNTRPGYVVPDFVVAKDIEGADFVHKVTDLGLGGKTRVHYEVGRAHAVAGQNYIKIEDNGATSVTVHELGHIIEGANSRDQIKIQRFLHDRIGDEQPIEMRSLNPDYDASEIAWKDNFDTAYIGKIYGGFRSSEVISMGLQYLYQDPVSFANRDGHFFDFVVSYLRGKL